LSGWGTGSRQPHGSEERTGCAPGARTSVSARRPFIRRPPSRWAENNLDRPSQCLRWASNRAHLSPGARNRVAGGRTSVSAPMGIHPQTPVPMGREPTWIDSAPFPLDIQPNTPSARAQKQGGGGADLCVRSNGHPSANPRPNGQRTNVDRLSPVSARHPTKHTVHQGPETGWRGGGPLCPLHWAHLGKKTYRWAAKQSGPANHPLRNPT
jgi:hypothetical protein